MGNRGSNELALQEELGRVQPNRPEQFGSRSTKSVAMEGLGGVGATRTMKRFTGWSPQPATAPTTLP